MLQCNNFAKSSNDDSSDEKEDDGITADSLISGHHRGNNFCPLIGGVRLFGEFNIFDHLWPREEDPKGSEFLDC